MNEVILSFLYDPVVMALWAGIATGALAHEAVIKFFSRKFNDS